MKIKCFSKKQIQNGRKEFYILDLWEFEHPLIGALIGDGFGMRYWDGPPRWHDGVDIGGATNYENAVKAVGGGTVIYAGNSGTGYGNLVVIRHGLNNGFYIESRYAHLKKINVRYGQKVSKGQTIGLVGGKKDEYGAGHTTSPHLHFEFGLRKPFGLYVPIDPMGFLPEIEHLMTQKGNATEKQYVSFFVDGHWYQKPFERDFWKGEP